MSSFNVALRVNESGGRFLRQHRALTEDQVVKHYRDTADELSLRGMCRVASIGGNDPLQKGLTADGRLLEVERIPAELDTECPRCGEHMHKAPVRYTFQGAAEFRCDSCEQFFQDFDAGREN